MVDTLLLRIYSTLPFLLYSSYLDLKYREIDSRIWRLMTTLGALFLLADVFLTKNPRLLLPFAIILTIAAVFSVSLHYFGMMGGGDAKLLIALGAMYPYLPHGEFLLPILFLSAFSNGILLSILIPLGFFARNIGQLQYVRTPKEFLRLFMAYKKDSKDLGSFETVLREGQIFINAREVELGKTGVEGEVWVTPAIPFIVFMTAGFVISVLYGDILALIY
jgi:preflagellin peptidase FlaK